MVSRTYSAPEFRVQGGEQFTQSQVARADTRVAPPLQVGDATWRDKLLGQIGKDGAALLNKMADIEYSNLYLEGQASAGIIESEAELEGNPLTRDWKVAGYRDTMGKLALADAEATFANDLPKLKEQGADALQAYLAKRRQQIMPGLASMSREARAASAGQLLLQDRAATKAWGTAHAAFILDQKNQAVTTQWDTTWRGLQSTQNQLLAGNTDAQGMQAQLRSATGTIVGSVWADASFPQDVKKNLTFQMLQTALRNDVISLYDYINDNPIKDGSGDATTLVARLDGEQQHKLSIAYSEAMNRRRDQRNVMRLEQLALFDANLTAGKLTDTTYNDVVGMLRPMLFDQSITGEQYKGYLNKYLDKQLSTEQDGALAQMALRGDMHGLYSAGKSNEEGLAAVDRMLIKQNASPEQRLQTYLQVGALGGFKKAGEVLQVSLSKLRTDGADTLPQHRQAFETVDTAVRKAEAEGLPNARMQVLAGMGEKDRMFVERVFNMVGQKASYDEAVKRATDLEKQEAQYSPAIRAAMTTGVAKDVAKEIAELGPRGRITSLMTGLHSMLPTSGGAEAQSDLKLRAKSYIGDRDGWFSDGATVQFYSQRVQEELLNEADRVRLTAPMASAQDVVQIAKANVAARTLDTRYGPLVLPPGTDLQRLFGVAADNQPAIGPALDKMLQNTKQGSNFQLAISEGRLWYQEVDSNGTRIGTGAFVNPQDVQKQIMQDTNARRTMADGIYGQGTQVKVGNSFVVYNGNNTAGVSPVWMYEFRKNLVQHEGLTDVPKADLSGKKTKAGDPIMTVGVGVSSHNPWYPKVSKLGIVEPEEIQRSFVGASNDAAKAGANVMKQMGMLNAGTFKLMSELAYQSGTDFMNQKNSTGERYRVFAGALQQRDVAAAQEAFKGTAAWYYSADPNDRTKITRRQRDYLALVAQAIKGE